MNYDDMTNEQVNMAVAEHIGIIGDFCRNWVFTGKIINEVLRRGGKVEIGMDYAMITTDKLKIKASDWCEPKKNLAIAFLKVSKIEWSK